MILTGDKRNKIRLEWAGISCDDNYIEETDNLIIAVEQAVLSELSKQAEDYLREAIESIIDVVVADTVNNKLDFNGKYADQLLPLITAYADKKVKEAKKQEHLAWYILDEIAVKHSGTHCGSGNTPCYICDRAEEAMRLLEKATHDECQQFYSKRARR